MFNKTALKINIKQLSEIYGILKNKLELLWADFLLSWLGYITGFERSELNF